MIEIANTLGNKACYSVLLILERISEVWEILETTEFHLPYNEWVHIAQLTKEEFTTLLEILEKHQVISTKNDEKGLTINCCSLSDLMVENKEPDTISENMRQALETQEQLLAIELELVRRMYAKNHLLN